MAQQELEVLYFAADPSCPASQRALELPCNQQYIRYRQFHLSGVPAEGSEAPWHRCFCLSIPKAYFDRSQVWVGRLGSLPDVGGIHLPEPDGSLATSVLFAFSYRPHQPLPGPNLFALNCTEGSVLRIHDPMNSEDEAKNQMTFLQQGTAWYLKSVRTIRLGSYSFLTHMPINNLEATTSVVTELQKIAEPLVEYDGQYLWKRLDILLGKGACGEVWLKRDMLTGTLKAVKQMKFLKSQVVELRNARAEMYRAKALNHDNIVKTFFGDEHDDTAAGQPAVRIEIVMDPYPISLQAMIEVGLAKTHVRHIGLDISEGLKYLQARHIFHCDLKPDNVLVRFPIFNEKILTMDPHRRLQYLDFNQKFSFCISDFGFSRQSEEYCQSYLGTPIYMAPEIRAINARRNVKIDYTNAVDVYSFGMIIFAVVDYMRWMKLLRQDGYESHQSVQRWAATRHHKNYVWALVSAMITVRAAHRPSIQAIRDAFFHEHFETSQAPEFEMASILEESTPPSTVIPALTAPKIERPPPALSGGRQNAPGVTERPALLLTNTKRDGVAGVVPRPKVDFTNEMERMTTNKHLRADNIFARAERAHDILDRTSKPTAHKKLPKQHAIPGSSRTVDVTERHVTHKVNKGGVTKKSGSSGHRSLRMQTATAERLHETLLESIEEQTSESPSKKVLAFLMAVPVVLLGALGLAGTAPEACIEDDDGLGRFNNSLGVKIPGAYCSSKRGL
ncbi:kinase-like domain-containing protein [Elsinoe ampelina]|uniref:Kinase-like domain-containing protein n=1 Tax=Elsinoe ampelina TaxID=302913 RepID=A0A6A6GQ50_9PEZI|nr:kinase-like domain-containing protein [Elsinoe ampelina]